jgi:fructose-1-phosphate kinase PfkB-like protein
MVAGFVLGKLRGLDLEGCARLASTFSLGALATVGPHLPPPESVEKSMDEIDVRVIAR